MNYQTRGNRTDELSDENGDDQMPRGRMQKKTRRTLWMVPKTPAGRPLATQGRAEVEAEKEVKNSDSHPGGLQVNYNAEYSVGSGNVIPPAGGELFP